MIRKEFMDRGELERRKGGCRRLLPDVKVFFVSHSFRLRVPDPVDSITLGLIKTSHFLYHKPRAGHSLFFSRFALRSALIF